MANNRPFGNNFSVDTPKLDQLEQRLYQEERQREIMRQRELAALDDEFSRNVTGIRDADVGDLTKMYGDWKMTHQQLMKQKDGVTPDQQMQLLRKKAEMYQLLNKSKADKEREKLLAKQIATDTKGIYDEKAAARLRERLKRPLSQFNTYAEVGADGKPVPVDLDDDNSYLYQLGTTDFSKQLKAAEGSKRSLNALDPEVDPKDPMKQLIRGYEGGNNPFDFYNTLIAGIAGSKQTKDFPLVVEQQYTPEQAAGIEKAFAELISDPKYKKIYGISPTNQFPASAYNTSVGRAAKLKAMEYALNNPPVEKIERVTNVDEQRKAREQFTREMTETRHRNSLSRLYVYAGIQADRPMSPNEIATGIDNLIRTHIETAKANGGELPVDEETFKAITGERKMSKGSYLTVDAQGEYKYGRKNPETGEVENLKPVPYQLVRGKLMEAYPKTRPLNQTEQPKGKVEKPKTKPKEKINW